MIDVGEAMNEGVVLAILLAVMITDGVLTKFLDFATLSFEVSQQNLSLYLDFFLSHADFAIAGLRIIYQLD